MTALNIYKTRWYLMMANTGLTLISSKPAYSVSRFSFRQNQLKYAQQDGECARHRELTIKLISSVNTNHVKLCPL